MTLLPHLALAPTPLAPGTLGAGRGPTLELAELADVELGLLARAVGDHLPPELAAQVLAVRARRRELEASCGA